jgi:hypothetical protein
MTEDRKPPFKLRDYFDQAGMKNFRAPAPSNVANVTEGPPVGALVSIFEQLAEMGVKRNTPYNS